MTMTTAALGTATLTVAAFLAAPLDAGNDADAPLPKIAKARLVSRGVELSLAPAGGRVLQAGDQAEFDLTALNTTDEPASVTVDIAMTASSPMDALSRTIRLPSALWQAEQVVTLQPRETKVVMLSTRTNLPPNSIINVSLREPGPKLALELLGITALSFSTVATNAGPAVALFQ